MLKENFHPNTFILTSFMDDLESDPKKKKPLPQPSSKAYINAMKALQERIKIMEGNLKSKEELIAKYKKEMLDHTEMMSKYQQILNENLENKKNMISLEKKFNDALTENSSLKMNLSRANIDHQENKDEIERFTKKNKELKTELDRAKLEIANFKTNFNSLNYQINQLAIENNTLQNEKTYINVERNNISLELNTLKSEKSQMLLDLERLKDENQNIKIDLSIIQKTHELLKNNYDTLRDDCEEKNIILAKRTDEFEALKIDYETQISNLEKNFQRIKDMYRSKNEELLTENFRLKNQLEYTIHNNENNNISDNICNNDKNLSPLPFDASDKKGNLSTSMRQEFCDFFENKNKSSIVKSEKHLKCLNNSEIGRYNLNEAKTPDFFQNKTFHFGKTGNNGVLNNKSSLKTDIASLENKISAMNIEYEQLLSKNKVMICFILFQVFKQKL